MRNCSENYKAQINKTLRNKSHVKIIVYDEDYNKDTHTGTTVLSIDTSVGNSSVQLKSCTYTQEIEPMCTKLPVEKISFTFYDLNKTFNPENPTGAWEKLNRPLPVAVYFGYELNSSNIEWIKMTVFVTEGENVWGTDKGTCVVTVTAKSIIGFLNDEFVLNEHDNSIISDTCKELLQKLETNTNNQYLKQWFDIDIPDISENYDLYKTIIGTVSEKEFLQLSSQCMCRELCVDENGKIKFKEHCNNANNFMLSFVEMLSFPTCKLFPVLSTLNIAYKSLQGGEWTLVEEVELSSSGEAEWQGENVVLYTFPTEVYAYEFDILFVRYNSGNTTRDLSNYIKYVDSAGVEHPGEVVLAPNRKDIMGQTRGSTVKYIYCNARYRELIFPEATTKLIYSSSIHGEPCTIENPLIESEESATAVQSNMLKYLKLRTKCENVTYRGNPELEAGDIIHVQTMYNEDIKALVTKNVVEYDGVLSGRVDFFLYPDNIEEETNDL